MKKISKNQALWIKFMGYDINKIKENMKSNSFAIEKLSKKEAIKEGCELKYNYRLFNPFNFDVK